jgi:carboxypeptidase C (cathepsin A)
MGTQTIAQTIQFNDNPDEWNSTATVQFADSTGVPYSPSPVPMCVTASAQRFE